MTEHHGNQLTPPQASLTPHNLSPHDVPTSSQDQAWAAHEAAVAAALAFAQQQTEATAAATLHTPRDAVRSAASRRRAAVVAANQAAAQAAIAANKAELAAARLAKTYSTGSSPSSSDSDQTTPTPRAPGRGQPVPYWDNSPHKTRLPLQSDANRAAAAAASAARDAAFAAGHAHDAEYAATLARTDAAIEAAEKAQAAARAAKDAARMIEDVGSEPPSYAAALQLSLDSDRTPGSGDDSDVANSAPATPSPMVSFRLAPRTRRPLLRRTRPQCTAGAATESPPRHWLRFNGVLGFVTLMYIGILFWVPYVADHNSRAALLAAIPACLLLFTIIAVSRYLWIRGRIATVRDEEQTLCQCGNHAWNNRRRRPERRGSFPAPHMVSVRGPQYGSTEGT